MAALVVLGGCGRGPVEPKAGSARDELRRAAETTVAAKSFVMHGWASGQSDLDGESTVVYQAPDRISRTRGAGDVEIFIGRTWYYNTGLGKAVGGPHAPPEDGFWRTETPEAGPSAIDGFMAELRVLAASTSVDRTGSSTYRWRKGTDRASVSGEATVEEGRVVRFSFAPEDPAWENVVMTYAFSDFDRAPAVDPPPVEKVVDRPALEPCGPDGSPKPGQLICGSSGGGKVPADVSLPAPTNRARSTLQLRPVRSIGAASCASTTENPPADAPARLAGGDGTCYDLGPAALDVERAQAAKPEPQPDGAAVALWLDRADTELLRRLFDERLGKQIAMVMFGAVQSAPVVHDTMTDGAIVVAGVDPQTAADILASLAG